MKDEEPSIQTKGGKSKLNSIFDYVEDDDEEEEEKVPPQKN